MPFQVPRLLFTYMEPHNFESAKSSIPHEASPEDNLSQGAFTVWNKIKEHAVYGRNEDYFADLTDKYINETADPAQVEAFEHYLVKTAIPLMGFSNTGRSHSYFGINGDDLWKSKRFQILAAKNNEFVAQDIESGRGIFFGKDSIRPEDIY